MRIYKPEEKLQLEINGIRQTLAVVRAGLAKEDTEPDAREPLKALEYHLQGYLSLMEQFIVKLSKEKYQVNINDMLVALDEERQVMYVLRAGKLKLEDEKA